MDKAEVLQAMQTEHTHLTSLLALLSEAQMCQPTLEGHRSVKDILAHITAWEQRCMGWIQAGLRNETPERPQTGYTWQDIHRLNEQDFLANQNRPLQEVLSDSSQSYLQFLEQVKALSEDDLTNSHRFSWWDGEPIITLIAANSYDHYREHADQIRAWIDKEILQA